MKYRAHRFNDYDSRVEEELYPWSSDNVNTGMRFATLGPAHHQAVAPSTYPWQQEHSGWAAQIPLQEQQQQSTAAASMFTYNQPAAANYPVYSGNNAEEAMQQQQHSRFSASPREEFYGNDFSQTVGYTPHPTPSQIYGADDPFQPASGNVWEATPKDKMTAVPDIFSLTRHNHYEQVEHLLDIGYSPNLRDANGNSILHIACQNGLKRIAKLALRRGAEINLQNYNGNTPLHFCFGLSFGETLGAYLISKGANPTIRNNIGMTCYEGFKMTGQ